MLLDEKRGVRGSCNIYFYGEEADISKENVDELFRCIAALKISIMSIFQWELEGVCAFCRKIVPFLITTCRSRRGFGMPTQRPTRPFGRKIIPSWITASRPGRGFGMPTYRPTRKFGSNTVPSWITAGRPGRSLGMTTCRPT